MNTTEYINAKLQELETVSESVRYTLGQISKVQLLLAELEAIPPDIQPPTIYSDITFSYLKHEQLLVLMKIFPCGTWNKEKAEDYSGNEYFRYEGTYKDITIILEGEPPNSCKIIEEEVVVPAIPERTKKVRRIVCHEKSKESQPQPQQQQQ